MADDARQDILKGLGVKRRRGDEASADAAVQAPEDPAAAESSDGGAATESAETESAETESAEAPAAEALAAEAPAAEPPARDKDLGRSLGIKRRSGANAQPSSSSSGRTTGSSTGLGFKRRGESARQEQQQAAPAGDAAAGDAAAEDEDDDDWVDPLAPVRGKLGSDDTAVMLANHFRTRTELMTLIPPRVLELERTHGHYGGDGRKGRLINVGWEPAYVLFTIPAYPDGPPKFTKDWKPIEPGPPRQPRFTAEGFVVPARLNRLGEWYVYVVFRSDGQPLEPGAEPAAPEQQKKTQKQDDTRRGLGIRRRR
ncbi:MAG: hypothetical protein AB7N76_20855 [Planctomycetota bacterium]